MRTRCEGLGDGGPLRPGSFITVMARRLQILSPADSFTRAKLSESTATRSARQLQTCSVQRMLNFTWCYQTSSRS
jgi:hypothetical protein